MLRQPCAEGHGFIPGNAHHRVVGARNAETLVVPPLRVLLIVAPLIGFQSFGRVVVTQQPGPSGCVPPLQGYVTR
jgi:hypothetical protein